MDARHADYLRHRMVRFSAAISETQEHFSELAVFGKYPASAPYHERSGIVQILDSLDADGDIRSALIQEFLRIEEQLTKFEEERGMVYRNLLHNELCTLLDVYAAAVCHANLGSVVLESGHDPFHRDRIAVLVSELEKDHDLTGVKNILRMLDANLSPPDAGVANPLPEKPLQHRRPRDRIIG